MNPFQKHVTLDQLHAAGFSFDWEDHGFPLMAKLVPVGTSTAGNVRVEHFRIPLQESAQLACDVLMNGDGRMFTPPGTYTKLLVRLDSHDPDYKAEYGGWCIMMSDSRAERIETARLLEVGTGHVLVAGLGLGMLVHALARKDGVKSVTVIEHNPEVAELVGPTLPGNVRVLIGDARTWAPDAHFDTVLMDIWPVIGETMHAELAAMRAHYAAALPGACIEGWLERELNLVEDLWDRVLVDVRATGGNVHIDLKRAFGMFLGRWNEVLGDVREMRRNGAV